MDTTPFIDKMNQVCEMQVASQDYIPIVVNESIIKSLSTDEVTLNLYPINPERYIMLT